MAELKAVSTDGPTIKEHYELTQRVALMEQELQLVRQAMTELQASNRRLVYTVITAVILAAVKGAGIL